MVEAGAQVEVIPFFLLSYQLSRRTRVETIATQANPAEDLNLI